MKNKFILDLFKSWEDEYTSAQDELTKLDSAGGDGDLGIVMYDGFKAVNEFVNNSEEEDVGKLFFQVGKQFNTVASSSMGTLLSSGFMNIGKQLKGKSTLEKDDLLVIVKGMADGVKNLGKAEEGDKTFLDGIYPASRAMEENKDKTSKEMMNFALEAAKKGVDNATQMTAKHGRLAFRKEASIGMIDPGSVVAMYYVKGIKDATEMSDDL